MSREQLVEEARAAGQDAKHNLKFIRSNPDIWLSSIFSQLSQ